MSASLTGHSFPPKAKEMSTLVEQAAGPGYKYRQRVKNSKHKLTERKEAFHLAPKWLRTGNGAIDGLHRVGRATNESSSRVYCGERRGTCGDGDGIALHGNAW